MMRREPMALQSSRMRLRLGRLAAFAVALITWGAASSAMAAGLAVDIHASFAPMIMDASVGAHAVIGNVGSGGCTGIGYSLGIDSMLFESQTPACSGFRAFDLAFLAVVALIVIAAIRFRHATARRRLELASRMVEKGIEPPPELVGARKGNDLRRGLVLVCTGIGLTLASWLSNAGGVSPAGLIPGFIGLGYLVSHRFAGPSRERGAGQ